MLGKRKHYENRRHFFSTPHMLGQSITNWGHNTFIYSKTSTESGALAEKNPEFQETNYVQGQIYKRFVSYLRQFLSASNKSFKNDLLSKTNEIFFFWTCRLKNETKLWSLQLCCNTANWKKEALKKLKPQTGFKPAPSRYLLNATISSTSADHINLKMFLKICCFEGQFYLYLQITVFQFTRNLISIVQNFI